MATSQRTTSPDPWVSVSRAARILGVSRQTVYAWVAEGKLEHRRAGGRMVLTFASVQKLALDRLPQVV